MEPQEIIYQVSEITHYIKHRLERDPALQGAKISGEISNLTYHRSGHVYFSLKDSDAQLNCAWFKSYVNPRIQLEEGNHVVAQGDISVYPPRGNYQLLVKHIEKAGIGKLYQAFLSLKEKLQHEGLFDTHTKQSLPAFPVSIAVLTSPTGAAVQDILGTLRRRYNRIEVRLIPTVVQGPQGKGSIVKNLQMADALGVDLIILARGGGSLEDLWNFNEEEVARAIAAAKTPVITGIGHETDFTIADFVADARASTPTAAAELSVPDKQALIRQLQDARARMQHALQQGINLKRQRLDDLSYRIEQAILRDIGDKKHQLALLKARLAGMDHQDLLKKGYTLTLKSGKQVTQAGDLSTNDQIETVFWDGKVRSVIE